MRKNIMTHIVVVSSLISMPLSSLNAQGSEGVQKLQYADRIILQSYKNNSIDIAGRNMMIGKLFSHTSNTSLSTQEKLDSARKLNDLIVSREKKRVSPKVATQKPSQAIPRGQSFSMKASAYTAAFDETDSGDGITASGKRVKENHTIACPRAYSFGTRIEIEGYGVYTCEDRGGAIKGNRFDIYMETKAEAFAFGRRTLNAKIIQ